MTEQFSGVSDLGIQPGSIMKNWNEARLYERSVAEGEGLIAKGGALVVKTGLHTGRSAKGQIHRSR